MSNPSLSSSKGPSALPHKIVIRNLPANLPEAIFWSSAEPYLSHYSWRDYHSGKLSKSKSKGNRSSTAYVNFESLENLVDFHANYNGHVFQDKQGNLSQASVEFAPFQKTPKVCKSDPRQGTIEKDPEYIAFLESLNPVKAPVEETKEAGPSGTIISGISNAQTLKQEAPKQITPLVEHLKSQSQRPRIVQKSKAPIDAPTGPKSMAQTQAQGGKKPAIGQLSSLAGKAKERHQKESKEGKGKGKSSAQGSRSSTPVPKAQEGTQATSEATQAPIPSTPAKADDKKRKPPKGPKSEVDKPKPPKGPKQQQQQPKATEPKAENRPAENKPSPAPKPPQKKAPSRAASAQTKPAPPTPTEPMPNEKAEPSERPNRPRINNTDGRNNRLMGGLLGARKKESTKPA